MINKITIIISQLMKEVNANPSLKSVTQKLNFVTIKNKRFQLQIRLTSDRSEWDD